MVNLSYLLAAAQLAACSIPDATFTTPAPADASAGDAGSDGGVQRTVTARWTLKHFATDAVISCPDASDIARVVAQPWSPVTQQPTSAPTISQDFACTAGMGVFMVPSDRYRMSVAIRTTTGQVVMNSDIEFADVTQGGGELRVIMFDDAGYITFSWDLRKKATQESVSCASAGITASDAIEMVETNIANPAIPTADDFDCDNHLATTAALATGHYALSINAVKNSAAFGDEVTVSDVQVVARDAIDIGNVKINVP
jgi:hypothetical protein